MSSANRRGGQDDAYHSDRDAYQATFERIRRLAVSVVHFPSFGPVRYRPLIDEYLKGTRQAGCHLSAI